jgi:uncharacterized protein (DUF885 family)
MLKAFFKEYVDLHPSFGSFLGMQKYDDKYENPLDPMHTQKLRQLCEKYSDTDDKTLQWIVKDTLEGLTYRFELMPLTSYNNDIIQFVFNNSRTYPLKTSRDLKNLISRYLEYIQYIKSCKTQMQIGITKQVTIPKTICKQLINQLKNKSAGEYIIQVPSDLQKNYPRIYEKYKSTVDMYYKEVQDILSFLETKYIYKCRDTYGLCGLENGKQMYKYAVKSWLTSEQNIEDLHQYGKTEIARISKEMHQLKMKLGCTRDMPLIAFYNKMRSDPKYQFTDKQELLDAYNKKKVDIRKNVIPQYFTDNVKPYQIKCVPSLIEGSSPGAFYIPGQTGANGTFYINLRNMEDNLKYLVTPLALHEGEPGHHYQFQYMLDNKLPLHKMYAVDGCAFTEGWALYSEKLYDYSDKPDEYFGKLTFELLRSVRLVVDTGIHYYGWSYRQAVNYMKKYIPLGKKDLESEVERYICMPAQALCYKVGERKILEWRREYIRCFGNDRIKQFHKTLLEDGILPLQVLDEKMKTICTTVSHTKLPEASNDLHAYQH